MAKSYQRTTKLPKRPPGKGPNGRPFCRWCGKEVPKGRRSWCSEACVDDYSIRSSPSYARQKVFERDRGVCANPNCGLDTEEWSYQHYLEMQRKFKNALAVLWGAWRWERWNPDAKEPPADYLEAMQNFALAWAGILAQRRYELWKLKLPTNGTLWHMDHIIPVSEGGGECGLENLRTLCVACHNKETAALRKRNPKRRKKKGRRMHQPDWRQKPC